MKPTTKILTLTVVLIFNFQFSINNCMAQLDTVHWIPPLHSRQQLSNNGIVTNHWLYLSTPVATLFTVIITDGAGTVLATPTISNTTPFKYFVASGQSIAGGSQLFIQRSLLNTVLTNKGIICHAPEPFYANIRTNGGNQADWATSKGRAGIGTTFRYGGFPQSTLPSTSTRNFTMGIMATQDSTTITFSGYNPAIVFEGVPTITPPASFTINLNEGECYVVAGNNTVGANAIGFMGALIQADKPIAMNNGNLAGTIHPTNNGNQDFGIDLSVPVERLGKEYILVEGQGNAAMEKPIVIAHTNNTEIYINGSSIPILTINAGQFFVVPNSNYQGTVGFRNMYIRTSAPTYVYQALASSSTNPNATGALVLIPPIDFGCFLPNNINLISAIDSIGGVQYTSGVLITTKLGSTVQINGGPPLTGAEPVLGIPWETYKIFNLTGNVSITSTNGVTASVVGLADPAGFAGYFSGFSTTPIASNFTFSDTCFNSNTVFNAAFDTEFLPDSITWNFGDPASGINNTSNIDSTTHNFTTPGTYTVQLVVHRCQNDTVTKTVTILPAATSTDVITSCSPITWIDGINYTTSTTTPTFTLVGGAVSGCDSVVTLNLTINAAAGTDVITSCSPITWLDGINYAASTTTPTFTIVGGAANGCDSVVTLNLTVNAVATSTDVITSCSPITWIDGINYTTSTTTPTFTIVGGAVGGCDSVVTLNLTINTAATSTQNPSICTGNTFTLPSGIIVTTAGTYNDTLTSVSGCDSVITTNLTVNAILTSTQNPSICTGNTFTLPSGIIVNTAGTYNDTLTSVSGCDSVITTNLTVNAILTSTQNPNICTGNTFTLPSGIIVNTAGTYNDTLTSVSGCDSVITTNLTVNAIPASEVIVPNVFSPNGDGNNDVFKIDNVGSILISIAIYNRWGTQLYESNSNDGWNGRTTSGKEAVEGTYFYILQIETDDCDAKKIETFKGTLTLLR